MKIASRTVFMAVFVVLVSEPAFANPKIEGTCLRSFITGGSGMPAKDYMPLCKCGAAELEAAGMSGAERRRLEETFDSELINKIFNRKPGSAQRADACMSAQRKGF
jgi:hypothetical protein